MVELFSNFEFVGHLLKSQRRSADGAARHAKGYSRSQNPAVIALCRTFSDMEQAQGCVVTSYGFGAILTLCLSQLKRGDHVIMARGCFDAHAMRLREYMISCGVDVSYVESDALDQWQAAVVSTTRMAFVTPCVGRSPELQAKKIRQLSMLLRHTGFSGQHIQLVVDNTHETAHRLQPLIHGADFVLYTSIKALERQGRVVAGAIVGGCSQQMSSVARCMDIAQVCVSPFNAWAILRGLDAENNAVLDHILDVGLMGDSDKVVSLQDVYLNKCRESVVQ